MPRRQYSDAEKATALAALDANGGNVQGTAETLGIPESTLSGWAKGRGTNGDVPKLRDIKKKDLADELEGIAYKLAKAIPDKIEEATLQQVTTSLGITIDKMQLLRGEATDNGTLKIQVVYADPDSNPS
jgi:transposase-like protein